MLFFSLYLAICLANTDDMIDSVDKISEYTDFNMMLAVQVLLPKTDSKDFVDRPTKKPLKEVVKAFRKIEKRLGIDKIKGHFDLYNFINKPYLSAYEHEPQTVKLLEDFLNQNFLPVGSDIEAHPATDYNESPRFLQNLTNKNLISVSKALNNTWKELSRKKVKNPQVHNSSLFDLPFPFMIPGGRFREFYYWDTYWILEGLLVCDMNKSAENIVRNFMHIIDKIGYIPNGTRKYYSYRSEPPYFGLMLLKLLDYENGIFNDLVLGDGLRMLEKEYEFWDKNRKIRIDIQLGSVSNDYNTIVKDYEYETATTKEVSNPENTATASAYKTSVYLNAYHVTADFPRPESMSEDLSTYKKQNVLNETQMYSNIKSGAESGWDFSTRWFGDSTDIATITAYDQIPVDLNALLYRNEVIMSKLFSRKGNEEKALYYYRKSIDRKSAMNLVLWNQNEGVWNDYNLKSKSFVNSRFYFSNVMPLVYGIEPVNGSNYDILKKYSKEIFGYKGGIPASGYGKGGQQWDFPNVWAPHQHMMVELLINMKEDAMAFHVAKSFFNSVYVGYKNDKAFFEKYNCLKVGFTGAGGEYAPQTGFGWTNGAMLSFILQYGDKIIEDYDHEKGYNDILVYLNKELTMRNVESAETSERNNLLNANNIEMINSDVKYRLVEEVTKKSLEEAQLAKLYNEIEKRKLYSKLCSARKNEHVSVSDSSRWLKKGNIRLRDEAVFCYIQDRNVFWGQ
ncbi:trehalase [Hamiltosporidium magnivora]|uniref:Trehalase n=1 Tax=Hamiltosporidium magnivora TaxID=148818 RepID=A0A4Q9L563_9MICR|nr:trehalase [Hamiltosporidium magnivora]